MRRIVTMTAADFDRILLDLMNEDGVETVFTIPGVYEAVSEFYNNAALERYEQEQETPDED